MKYFFAHCKKMFSKSENGTNMNSQNEEVHDIADMMKGVDEQVGRAVTRLAER